jgi:hypothetical protein
VFQLAGLDPQHARGKKTQYPIFDSPELFAKMPPNFLQGVPPQYRAQFREFQPYEPRFALLGAMARLNDRDKHDMINPIVCLPLGLTLRGHGFHDIRVPQDPVYLDDGTVLAWFKFRDEVEMEGLDFRFTVRFGLRDGTTIDTSEMRVLIDRIAEILGRFRSAFDGPVQPVTRDH